MIRQMAIVGSGTALSRLLGFLRDVLLGAIFGSGPIADAFFVALQLINVVRRFLAEGALNAALVPAYLAMQREGASQASQFAGRVLGTIGFGLFLLALIAGIVMPQIMAFAAPGFAQDARLDLAVAYARLMMPYIAFAGPVTVLAGLLNAHRRFALTAFAPILFNVLLIVAALLVLLIPRAADDTGLLLAAMIGAAGFLQLLALGFGVRDFGAQDGQIAASPVRVTFDPAMRAFLKRALPGMAASILPQAVMVAGALLASGTMGAVSWFYFANRLIELPLGIVSVAMGTVLLPTLSTAQTEDDLHAQNRTQDHGVELALGLSLPAAIGLALLAHPIVEILFERGAFNAGDTRQTAMLLAILAAGLPGHALAKALAPSFFARGDVIRPALAALAGFAMALIGGWALMQAFGLGGIAAGLMLSGWAASAIMVQGATKSMPSSLYSRLARIVASGLAMGLAVWLVEAGLEPLWRAHTGLFARALILAALIGAGFLVYYAALRLLRVIGPGGGAPILRRR